MSGFFGAGKDAYTDELCSTDARAQRVRAMLYRLEAQGERSGWDGPLAMPQVITVSYLRDGVKVAARTNELYTESMREAMDHNDGNAGAALRRVASVVELAAGMARSTLEGGDHLDVHGGQTPGWGFYGVAMRSEVWGVVSGDAAVRALADERRLDEHPDRVEMRMIVMYDRTGTLWSTQRPRGSEPWVFAVPPGRGDSGLIGNVPNALSRMVNAVIGESVPILPQD